MLPCDYMSAIERCDITRTGLFAQNVHLLRRTFNSYQRKKCESMSPMRAKIHVHNNQLQVARHELDIKCRALRR